MQGINSISWIVGSIIMCHLLGDYVLQMDFIAQSKGENPYHMFIHCFLYCVPFAIMFGFNTSILLLFISHCVIDPLKARYHKISYTTDQILHYLVALVLYLFLPLLCIN